MSGRLIIDREVTCNRTDNKIDVEKRRMKTMKQDAYPDKLILELRRKCRQEQPDALVGEQKEFKRVILCDGLCTIRLPSYMHAMKQRERLIKYRNAMMPEIIIADGNSDATFTFNLVGQAEKAEKPEQRAC